MFSLKTFLPCHRSERSLFRRQELLLSIGRSGKAVTVTTENSIEFMAEFKFICPDCKQHIQCDSLYVGSQINCPACQQLIMVPPIPPSVIPAEEKTFQIKVSSLRNVALIILGVILAVAIFAAPVYFLTGKKSVTFKAYVDGTDVVKISGDRLWIEHQDWRLPTKITINGDKWNPEWNGNNTMPYELHHTLTPHNLQNFKLSKRLGRGDVMIAETPTAANGQTLAIKVDDGSFGGADWYEFTVSW